LQYQVSNAQQCSDVSTIADFFPDRPLNLILSFPIRVNPQQSTSKGFEAISIRFQTSPSRCTSSTISLQKWCSTVQLWCSECPRLFFLSSLVVFHAASASFIFAKRIEVVEIGSQALIKTAQFYCILDMFVPVVEGFSEHENGHGVSF